METQQTTTEPTTQNAPPAPSAEEPTGDLESRAASLLAELSKEPSSDAEAPAEAEQPAAEAAPAADEDAAATARRERIAARNQALAELAAKEREKVAAAKARKAEREPAPPPPQAAPPIKDAASFFAMAEQLNIPPQELAEWLTRQADPTKVAQHAAKEALTPLEQRLAEQAKALEQLEAQIREREESARTAQLAERNARVLLEHLDAVAQEAPRSDAFRREAPDDFFDAVESIAKAMPPGFTAQDVIDRLEEQLARLRAFGPASQPTNTRSAPTTTPAAAKAHLGNRMAAERATTVEEDEDTSVDLEERAKRLKARLGAR